MINYRKLTMPILVFLIFFLYLSSSLIQVNFNSADRITGFSFAGWRVLSGDVPHYVAVVYSLVYDGDFDLSNNYFAAEKNRSCDVGFYHKGKILLQHHVRFVDKNTGRLCADKAIMIDNTSDWFKMPLGKSSDLEDYYQFGSHSIGLPAFLFIFLWPLKYVSSANSCLLEQGSVLISILVSFVGLIFLYKLLSCYSKNKNSCKIALLIFALATPLWHYSRTLWPEIFLFSILTIALYLLRVKKYSLLVGVIVAIGIAIKLPFVIIGAVLAMHFFLKKEYKHFILYISPILVMFILLMYYNYLLFGHPLNTSQTYYFSGQSNPFLGWGNPVVSFIGMLFSASQGLFPFTPLLFFSLFGLKRLYSERKQDFWLFASIFVLYYSFWAVRGLDWEGGGYSNRYLVPIIVLFAVPFCMSYEYFVKNRFIKYVFYLFLFYSFIINALAGVFPAIFWNQSLWHIFVLLIFKFSRVLEVVGGSI